jgi:hypothetical protein
MKYEDGQTVMLGDIVTVDLHDGDHTGRIVMIGDTGEHFGVDEESAKWALESGHVGKDDVMLEWIEPNPLAHDDPRYAPVENTLSTCLCGMVLVRRKDGAQHGVAPYRR